MLGERKNISAPIAQGWNRKREHVQAEVQIFPKTACFDSRRKVHIRQGHDTRFDAQRFRAAQAFERPLDRKSTRLNSSHGYISYAVFCLKKKTTISLDNLTPLLLA